METSKINEKITDAKKKIEKIIDDKDKERIKNAEIKLLGIIDEKNKDAFHTTKRVLSFEYLDKMLNDCNSEYCPIINSKIKDDLCKYLTDISIECYINERAYFYSHDKIGKDDIERYNMAKMKILKILYCMKKPTESIVSLFNYDSDKLFKDGLLDNAKKRKAYWSYMKNKYSNNEIANYYNACSLLNEISSLPEKINDKKIEHLRLFILNNIHILNGIELYKFCTLRQLTMKEE